jgi:hypothetical protein
LYHDTLATAGNFAYGLGGKLEIEHGPCAQFSIYHLMQLKDDEMLLLVDETSCGLFRQEVAVLGVQPEATTPIITPEADPAVDTAPKDEVTPKADVTTHQIEKSKPTTLGDISKLLRSKAAGPYEITFDVMFDSEEEYQLVKESRLLTTASMAKLFAVQEDDIVWDGFFDQALAYKATIPRLRNGKPTAAGGYMENDVHGSQMYLGLMDVELPEMLMQALKL